MRAIDEPWEIYVLLDPRPDKRRVYVGKSSDVTKRIRQHCKDRGDDTACGRWCRKLVRLGLRPLAAIVERGSGEWRDAEKRWVALVREAAGRDMLNETGGGEGVQYWELPEATRNKLASGSVARWKDPEYRARVLPVMRAAIAARVVNHEAMRESARKRFENPAELERVCRQLANARMAPAQISEMQKRVWANKTDVEMEAVRASRSVTGRESWRDPTSGPRLLAAARESVKKATAAANTPEGRAANAAAMRKRYENHPERREAMRERARLLWATRRGEMVEAFRKRGADPEHRKRLSVARSTKIDELECIAAWSSGESTSSIGARLHTSPARIATLVRAAGHTVRRGVPPVCKDMDHMSKHCMHCGRMIAPPPRGTRERDGWSEGTFARRKFCSRKCAGLHKSAAVTSEGRWCAGCSQFHPDNADHWYEYQERGKTRRRCKVLAKRDSLDRYYRTKSK